MTRDKIQIIPAILQIKNLLVEMIFSLNLRIITSIWQQQILSPGLLLDSEWLTQISY